jgi:hypothetical protein
VQPIRSRGKGNVEEKNRLAPSTAKIGWFVLIHWCFLISFIYYFLLIPLFDLRFLMLRRSVAFLISFLCGTSSSTPRPICLLIYFEYEFVVFFFSSFFIIVYHLFDLGFLLLTF